MPGINFIGGISVKLWAASLPCEGANKAQSNSFQIPHFIRQNVGNYQLITSCFSWRYEIDYFFQALAKFFYTLLAKALFLYCSLRMGSRYSGINGTQSNSFFRSLTSFRDDNGLVWGVIPSPNFNLKQKHFIGDGAKRLPNPSSEKPLVNTNGRRRICIKKHPVISTEGRNLNCIILPFIPFWLKPCSFIANQEWPKGQSNSFFRFLTSCLPTAGRTSGRNLM